MSRFATVIVVCFMFVIAFSMAIILYVQFQLSGLEAAMAGCVSFIAMAVGHILIERGRERNWLELRLQEVAELASDASKESSRVAARVTAIDTDFAMRVRAEVDPVATEVEVIGSLLRQIAEAVADVDDKVERRLVSPAAQPQLQPQAYQQPLLQQMPIPQPAPMPMQASRPAMPQPVAQPAMPRQGMMGGPQPMDQTGYAPMAPQPGMMHQQASGGGISMSLMGASIADQPFGPLSGPAGSGPAGRPRGPETALDREVAEAIRRERIEIFLQPIVTLPQRKVRFYEVQSRLRDTTGDFITGENYVPSAEQMRLMSRLDNFVVLKSIQIIKRLTQRNRDVGLFVNLSAQSLLDAAFVREFLNFIRTNGDLVELMYFEMPQGAYLEMGPIETETMEAMREAGAKFSLDHVVDLTVNFADLSARGIRFLKVRAERLLHREKLQAGNIHPQDLSTLLARFGIELVADHLEREAQVVDLLDFDMRLGQGYLFSVPRPVRPEVFTGVKPAAAAGPIPSQAPAQARGQSSVQAGVAPREPAPRQNAPQQPARPAMPAASQAQPRTQETRRQDARNLLQSGHIAPANDGAFQQPALRQAPAGSIRPVNRPTR